MKKIVLVLIMVVISCATYQKQITEVNVIDSSKIRKELSIKNLSDSNYCDSIGLTTQFEVTEIDSIIASSKYPSIVEKYIKRLPKKDIQIQNAIKYEIPIELVILWNFQESDFINVKHNGNLNSGKAKDWGSLQVNASGNNKVVKHYIMREDYENYYDLAFSFMVAKKSRNKKTWFTNWNSKNPTQAKKYYKSFLNRTKRNNTQLRKLMES